LNHKFAAFYVTVISVALVGSLSASHLNPAWNRVVFRFPPEAQEVVENGTAVMDVSWRWLPETLEMIVKVNDDETNTTFITSYENGTLHNRNPDVLVFLFDSDNNGRLTTGWNPNNWTSEDDHAVMVATDDLWNPEAMPAVIFKHCFVDDYPAPGFISTPLVWTAYPSWKLENWTRTFSKDEGYTFHLSIPIELINVKPPTTMLINFHDGDYEVRHFLGGYGSYEEAVKLSLLVAEWRDGD
jgi:hypothetical protein